MGWCNYIVDKKNNVSIPLGKMDEDTFMSSVSVVEQLLFTIQRFNMNIEDDTLVSKQQNQLSLFEIHKLVVSYLSIKHMADEEMCPFKLIAVSYYITQKENGNVMKFYTEDAYAKETLSGTKFTVLDI
jgi:hypothetical protein